MKVDRSTKVILVLIAIGLFLNAADKFSVDPVEAAGPNKITLSGLDGIMIYHDHRHWFKNPLEIKQR